MIWFSWCLVSSWPPCWRDVSDKTLPSSSVEKQLSDEHQQLDQPCPCPPGCPPTCPPSDDPQVIICLTQQFCEWGIYTLECSNMCFVPPKKYRQLFSSLARSSRHQAGANLPGQKLSFQVASLWSVDPLSLFLVDEDCQGEAWSRVESKTWGQQLARMVEVRGLPKGEPAKVGRESPLEISFKIWKIFHRSLVVVEKATEMKMNEAVLCQEKFERTGWKSSFSFLLKDFSLFNLSCPQHCQPLTRSRRLMLQFWRHLKKLQWPVPLLSCVNVFVIVYSICLFHCLLTLTL